MSGTRRTAAEALELLDRFQQEHGRLPKSTATDPSEKYLANFLFIRVRSQEKRGILAPALRELAALIPGALALDTHPDQDEVLAELTAFVQEYGRAPRYSRQDVPAAEIRLRSWIGNNTSSDPARKSPRLRARHEAILAVLAGVPNYAEKELDDRITAAEQFVRDHGHRPSCREMPWLQAYAREADLLDRPFGERSHLNDIRAARIKAILASPWAVDLRWQRNFDELAGYAASRGGSLPTTWDEHLFTWLTVQRRAYRQGKLSADRIERLLAVPGILPMSASLPVAA